MGWFFRKGFKIAPGFRINLSKTGVGLSSGIRGLRFSVGPGRKPRVYGGIGPFRYQKSIGSSRSRDSNGTGNGCGNTLGCGCLIIVLIIIGSVLLSYYWNQYSPPQPPISQPTPIIIHSNINVRHDDTRSNISNSQLPSISNPPASLLKVASDFPSDLFFVPSNAIPSSKSDTSLTSSSSSLDSTASMLNTFRASRSEYVPFDFRANNSFIGYVKAFTNMYVPDPLFTYANLFVRPDSKYSYFGRMTNGYLIVINTSIGSNIISLIPFCDAMGNKTVVIEKDFVIIQQRVKLDKGVFPIDSLRYYPVSNLGTNTAVITWYSPKSKLRRNLTVPLNGFVFISTNIYEKMLSRLETEAMQNYTRSNLLMNLQWK